MSVVRATEKNIATFRETFLACVTRVTAKKAELANDNVAVAQLSCDGQRRRPEGAGPVGLIVEISGLPTCQSARASGGKSKRGQMAVRARPDNLSLDHASGAAGTALPFAELWELRHDLRVVCDRMVGDVGEADDVVQDPYVRAIETAAFLDQRASYAPWLATVARRRAIDHIRARKRLRVVAAPPEPPPGHAPDPLEHVLRQEAIDRVRAGLGTLGDRDRRLLLHQVSDGLSIAELAQAEDTTEASVRSALTRARSKLRAAVERQGPLAGLPGPGVVAAVKRRLQRWATALDGRTPVLTGIVVQLGDMVAVAITAAVLLLGSTAPAPDALAFASTSSTGIEATGSARTDPAGAADTPVGSAEGSGGQPSQATTGGATTSETPPTTVVPSPSEYVDVPWLRDRDGGAPEAAVIKSLAASADGRAVLAAGPTNTGGHPAVYRSTDGGHSWERLAAAGFLGGQLLVAPSHPNDPTILAVNENGPLWRSDDNGKVFLPAATPSRGAAALVPGYGPGNRRVVLATPQLAVYDVDSGRTSPLGLGPSVTSVGGVATTPGFAADPVVFVGGSVRSGIGTVATVHRCRSFAPCSSVTLAGSSGAATIHLSSQANLVIAHSRLTLHRSTDGGTTFTQVPLPVQMEVKNVVDGAPGELLLAGLPLDGSSSGGLLRSSDGGQTWAPLGAGTALAAGSMQVLRLATGHILAALHPRFGGFLCSADNGATWAPRCPSRPS
jgi:RNA polymerase sigma-70 factor (ECF subfamily)